MTLKDQLDALLDATAFDSTGTKIGAVRQVYVDDATGKATFATVGTGIFSADAIVPLHGARLLDGELHVAHTRGQVRESPRADDTEDGLTPDQEKDLLEHYGVEVPAGRPVSTPAEAAGADPGKGDSKDRDDRKDDREDREDGREDDDEVTGPEEETVSSPAAGQATEQDGASTADRG